MQTATGLEIPLDLAALLHPPHCALIVYDMQAGIIRQIGDGIPLMGRIRRLLDWARGVSMPVFFTRHLSLPKRLMGVSQFRMAMAWQRARHPDQVDPWFLRDSPGFAIVPELQPSPDEAIFDKLAMSAFEGTPLNMALRDRGIRSFLIAGVATEIGIDLTCRHGADLGFVPILVRDACGAGHPEAAERALATLAFLGDTLITDLATVTGTPV